MHALSFLPEAGGAVLFLLVGLEDSGGGSLHQEHLSGLNGPLGDPVAAPQVVVPDAHSAAEEN